jgi:hypothetical protein
MAAKLEQKVIDAGCAAARDRYAAMPADTAKTQFAYEMQGFLAAMSDRHEWPLLVGISKMVELLQIIANANGLGGDNAQGD